MLGSLINTISASFGKSFVYAGLLPATVLLAVVSFYWIGVDIAWLQVEGIATAMQKAKAISQLGIAWVVAGFILFAIRTWIFELFRILPTGRLGLLVLRRSLKERERLKRDLLRLEWEVTIASWSEREFSPTSAIYRPSWYKPVAVPLALEKSKNARARLCVVTREPLRVYPNWSDRCILIEGLTHLFGTITDPTVYSANQSAIDCEVAAWIEMARRPRAKTFLNHLTEQIKREWAASFARNSRYSKGLWIYPTRIGNRLAALDDYAERRYGITTDTIWGRLWWVLPSAVKQEVSDARLAVEAATNLAAALIFAAATIVTIEIARNISWVGLSAAVGAKHRAVILIIMSLILAAISYRGAIFALDSLASKMSTLIDLLRLQLIAALGLRPETIRDENDMWSELDQFFGQATARNAFRKLTLPKPAEEDEIKIIAKKSAKREPEPAKDQAEEEKKDKDKDDEEEDGEEVT